MKTLETLKTKKIAPGYYQGEYRGVKYNVSKVEEIGPDTRNQWFWEIGNVGGDDWFSGKAKALEAVKSYIDDLKHLHKALEFNIKSGNYPPKMKFNPSTISELFLEVNKDRALKIDNPINRKL